MIEARASRAGWLWAVLPLPAVLLAAWLRDPAFGAMVAAALAAMVWDWGRLCRWRLAWLLPGAACIVLGLACYWLLGQFGPLFSWTIPIMGWAGDAGAAMADTLIRVPAVAPASAPGKSWSGVVWGIAAALGGGMLAGISSASDLRLLMAGALLARVADLGLSAAKHRLGAPAASLPPNGAGRVVGCGASTLAIAIATAALMLLRDLGYEPLQ